MLPIAIAMLVVLAVTGLVVVYVVYPHRGEKLPAAPWLGKAMTKTVDSLPRIEDSEEPEDDTRRH